MTIKRLKSILKSMDTQNNVEIVDIINKIEEENLLFRKALWLNHGCHTARLDWADGDMICWPCNINFKKDDISKIAQSMIEHVIVFDIV